MRGTVLLVEDDPALRRTATRILVAEGHHVLSASGAEDALALAATHEGSIDLLVTDVVLGGMNGRDLRDRLLETHGALPALLMSGYVGDDLQRRSIGADLPLLPKPFTSDALLDAVARAMASRPN